MAYNTKLRLIDAKMEQPSGSTLTLSGNTIFEVGSDGIPKYSVHPDFTGITSVYNDPQVLVDKQYVDEKVFEVEGDLLYDLESPAVVKVGGVEPGTVLTGKTANQILEEILVPELFGELTDASATATRTPTTSTYEVGVTIPTLTVNASFSRGLIDPQYESDSQFRSGLPNTYTYSGPSISTTPKSITTTGDTESISNYVISLGTQNWGVTIAFDAGVQPKGSKGSDFNSPLGAGTRSANTSVINGYYPVFYGYTATKPTAGQALLTDTNTAKLIIPSDGNISINFGSSGNGYMWFATPAASTTKVHWREVGNFVNNGPIGSTQLFESPSTVSIDSPDAFWIGQSYKFYIGGFSGDIRNYEMLNTTP